jgi:hypothetical protein
MSGLTTLLASRIESLLPRADAAACVPASPWCSGRSTCDSGHCHHSHRNCHLSCHGKAVCTGWTGGAC